MQPFEFFVLLSGAIANSFCSSTLFHFFAPLFPPSPPSTLTFRVKESSKPLSIGYGLWMCWNPDNYRRKCRRSALKDESNNFEGKLQELKRDVQKMKMAKERGKWETKRDVEESNKDRHERVNMENRALAEWRINIARIMIQFQRRARTRIISRDMIVSSRRQRVKEINEKHRRKKTSEGRREKAIAKKPRGRERSMINRLAGRQIARISMQRFVTYAGSTNKKKQKRDKFLPRFVSLHRCAQCTYTRVCLYGYFGLANTRERSNLRVWESVWKKWQEKKTGKSEARHMWRCK